MNPLNINYNKSSDKVYFVLKFGQPEFVNFNIKLDNIFKFITPVKVQNPSFIDVNNTDMVKRSKF